MEDGQTPDSVHHILVADPDPALCTLLRTGLEAWRRDCRVTSALTAQAAEAVLENDWPDAAIVDKQLLQHADFRLASRTFDAGVPVLILTEEPAAAETLNLVGFRCMAKPISLGTVLDATRQLLGEARRRQAEVRRRLARMRETRNVLCLDVEGARRAVNLHTGTRDRR